MEWQAVPDDRSSGYDDAPHRWRRRCASYRRQAGVIRLRACGDAHTEGESHGPGTRSAARDAADAGGGAVDCDGGARIRARLRGLPHGRHDGPRHGTDDARSPRQHQLAGLRVRGADRVRHPGVGPGQQVPDARSALGALLRGAGRAGLEPAAGDPVRAGVPVRAAGILLHDWRRHVAADPGDDLRADVDHERGAVRVQPAAALPAGWLVHHAGGAADGGGDLVGATPPDEYVHLHGADPAIVRGRAAGLRSAGAGDRPASICDHQPAGGAVMLYRIQQVGWRLAATFGRVRDDEIAGALPPELVRLFRRMRSGDQAQSLRVMRRLIAQGHTKHDLLAAARLHDCGKARYRYTLLDLVFVLMAKRLAPGWYARRSQGAARGVFGAVAIAEQHPIWSAEDMAAAGASATACSLARRHQEQVGEAASEEDRLLLILQAVDDAS